MKYKKIIGILVVLIALSMTLGSAVAGTFINGGNNNMPPLYVKSTQVTIDVPEVVKDRNPFYIIGKLTDENGNPVADATLVVRINNKIPRLVTTDDNGQYTVYFAPRENGVVNVEVSFSSAIGYIGCTNSTSFLVDIPCDNCGIVIVKS